MYIYIYTNVQYIYTYCAYLYIKVVIRSFCSRSSDPGIGIGVSALQADSFQTELMREALYGIKFLILSQFLGGQIWCILFSLHLERGKIPFSGFLWDLMWYWIYLKNTEYYRSSSIFVILGYHNKIS